MSGDDIVEPGEGRMRVMGGVARPCETEGDDMRGHIVTLGLLLAPGIVFGDEMVAGHWHGKIDEGIEVILEIAPNGHWSSETRQNNTPVRRVEGTYTQKPDTATTGQLVLTPTNSTVGQAAVQSGRYIVVNPQTLRFESATGNTVVFRRR